MYQEAEEIKDLVEEMNQSLDTLASSSAAKQSSRGEFLKILLLCLVNRESPISREHMNPQLTCSQRQWLHSSVGGASHQYHEVTDSNPVEVLNLRLTVTIIPSFHFISAVHM